MRRRGGILELAKTLHVLVPVPLSKLSRKWKLFPFQESSPLFLTFLQLVTLLRFTTNPVTHFTLTFSFCPLFISPFELLIMCPSPRFQSLEREREREREREMGKGRIEIKKIENPTNRQVTYSKRRLGIMKKARELTVLCDADVSIIMFSTTGKLADYCSPSTNTKRIMDRYQQVTGVDLWKDQYEKMQNTLRNLEEINRNLRREIRQRMGEDLDGLSVKELRGLEQSLDESLCHVRDRKYHVITTQTDTYKKKLKSTHEAHKHLLRQLEMKDDLHDFGFMTDNAVSMANRGSQMFTFRIPQNLLELGYGSQDFSLA